MSEHYEMPYTPKVEDGPITQETCKASGMHPGYIKTQTVLLMFAIIGLSTVGVAILVFFVASKEHSLECKPEIVVAKNDCPDTLESTCNKTDRCPDGWQTFQDSCYLVGPNLVTNANAQVYCVIKGAYVVHVDGTEENLFLKSYLSQLKGNNYWIGLTDERIDGIWRSTNDDNIATFFDWGPGEPTNSNGGEACILFYNSIQFKWVDASCSSNARPLCEKKINV